ncbi:hypothetical protein GCM10018790_70250 [Kitasatospora xanthocidica]|uniref:hypothetical protein n=1 Tax=Kitasatospora xanthocidica TaxID=83382 RepID=UPI001678EAF0|nr:hypothetical protein [Kitasatospora xanthocidica]GHF82519.1 hypothetical protein GCM10018790_70250 [Kitasatospora xanthocidica]
MGDLTYGRRGWGWAAPAAVALAVLAVAGGSAVWAWSQDRPVGGARLWVCAVALAVAVAAGVPLSRRAAGRGFAPVASFAVLLLLALWGTAFAAAQAADTVRTRVHEPPSVWAVVTHCRVTGQVAVEGGGLGDRTYGCTYRWSVDGRQFSEERPVDKPYPDNHEVKVWLEDGGRMTTGRPSLLAIPFWIVLALACLAAAVASAVRLGGWAEDAGLRGP